MWRLRESREIRKLKSSRVVVVRGSNEDAPPPLNSHYINPIAAHMRKVNFPEYKLDYSGGKWSMNKLLSSHAVGYSSFLHEYSFTCMLLA